MLFLSIFHLVSPASTHQPCTNHASRIGNLASLVSSVTPAFEEWDLYPPPRIENNVKTSLIWHSPLYSPSGAYASTRTPRNSVEALTAELCRNVQSWLRTFEGECDKSGEESMVPYRQHCRESFELFRPYAGSSASESEHVYECCRLSAHLMLRAESLHCALREAAQGTTLLAQVDAALQKTDLFNLWGPRIGLLYWVLLVSCTSMQGSSFNRNPATISLNFLIGRVAISDYHVEVGLRPLQRLKWFNDRCVRKL